jgi:hypothetical protein
MGNALKARDTFTRVVQEFGTALPARRAQLYLEFIKQRHGDHPQESQGRDPGWSPAERQQWMRRFDGCWSAAASTTRTTISRRPNAVWCRS